MESEAGQQVLLIDPFAVEAELNGMKHDRPFLAEAPLEVEYPVEKRYPVKPKVFVVKM
jgi:hypothetical protein